MSSCCRYSSPHVDSFTSYHTTTVWTWENFLVGFHDNNRSYTLYHLIMTPNLTCNDIIVIIYLYLHFVITSVVWCVWASYSLTRVYVSGCGLLHLIYTAEHPDSIYLQNHFQWHHSSTVYTVISDLWKLSPSLLPSLTTSSPTHWWRVWWGYVIWWCGDTASCWLSTSSWTSPS